MSGPVPGGRRRVDRVLADDFLDDLATADLATLDHMLAHWGPQIIETEFRPGGDRPPADQHFVLALAFTFGRGDLIIIDPWDGAQTHLLERYALDSWDLARAIFGVRAFSPAHDPSTP